MDSLDASYSGITKMIDEEGVENTLRLLQEEWALQISRLQTAQEQLKKSTAAEQIARRALGYFAVALNQRKDSLIKRSSGIMGEECFDIVSYNAGVVIHITVSPDGETAFYKTFPAINLTKTENENG